MGRRLRVGLVVTLLETSPESSFRPCGPRDWSLYIQKDSLFLSLSNLSWTDGGIQSMGVTLKGLGSPLCLSGKAMQLVPFSDVRPLLVDPLVEVLGGPSNIL